MNQQIAVFFGLDVGKSGHHATALDRDGCRLFDHPLPQDEAKLRGVFTRLQAHGRVLVIVDQPNTVGALPIAVARDAFIIADSARPMPHTLRQVDRDSEVLSALKVLAGFDADLTYECARAINRLRGPLLQIFPTLERVLPEMRIPRPAVLELLIHYGGSTGLRSAGRGASCGMPATIHARAPVPCTGRPSPPCRSRR